MSSKKPQMQFAHDTANVQYRKILCSLCSAVLSKSVLKCDCPNNASIEIKDNGIEYSGHYGNKLWKIGADEMPTPTEHTTDVKIIDLSKMYINLTCDTINLMNYANVQYAVIKPRYTDYKLCEIKNWTWGMAYENHFGSQFPVPVRYIKDEKDSDLDCVPVGLKKEDKILVTENIGKLLIKQGYTNVYILDNSEKSIVIDPETNKILGYKSLIRFL